MNVSESVQQRSPQHRKLGLDLLRVYAIFSIIYGHGWVIAQHFATEQYKLIKFESVTVFFALTGFFVAYKFFKILDSGNVSWLAMREYWWARFVKIYPIYFLMLSLIGLHQYAIHQPLPPDYWYSYFFSQNLFAQHHSVYPELWSLAILEWVCFIFPIFIWLIHRFVATDQLTVAVKFVLLFITLGIVYRTVKTFVINPQDVLTWDNLIRKQVMTRIDSTLYGCFAAYLFVKYPDQISRYAKHALALGILLMMLDKHMSTSDMFYLKYLNLSIAPIAATLLLPYFFNFDIKNSSIRHAITRIGTLGLAMYMLHLTPIMSVLMPNLMPKIVQLIPYVEHFYFQTYYALYWVLTLVFAIVLHDYFSWQIEKKFLSVNHIQGNQ